MKHIVLLALLCLPFLGLTAQENCATVMPNEMIEWLRDYKTNNRAPLYNKTSDVTFIPVKIHIVGKDDGTSHYKLSTLFEALCTLNNQYEPYGWRFYMYNGINYIDNSTLNDHTSGFRNIINAESVVNVVNIFFVDDPSGACGYFTGSGGPRGSNGQRQGYIAIQDGTCAAPDNSTIAHELGHFFSLPHTFFGWEGSTASDPAGINDERVDGSNCGYSGDYFCDTPADYLSDRWSCPYNKTKTDYNGDLYAPDGELYMSYSNDACTRYFSEEQLDAMRSYLAGTRSYLLSNPYPGYLEITDSAEIVLPGPFSSGIAANFVNLKWRKVENATQYLLQVKVDGPQINFFIDSLVTDTSFVLQLSEYKGYAFRVKAINPAYTCSAMSNFTIFTTGPNSPLNPSVTVESVSCNNAFDGVINLNVQGGQGPYTYSWSNGATSASLNNLTQGKYIVTVTDQNNATLAIDIDIIEPSILDVEFEQVGNSLITDVTGGTPSYTYTWSTGTSGTGVQLNGAGEYSVTVTDGNGCTASKIFSATGINDVLLNNNFIVYPNPLPAGQDISIEFELSQNILNGKVEVFESTGRLVNTVDYNFTTGTNTLTINGSALQAGIYFIRLKGDNVLLTKKLLVL